MISKNGEDEVISDCFLTKTLSLLNDHSDNSTLLSEMKENLEKTTGKESNHNARVEKSPNYIKHSLTELFEEFSIVIKEQVFFVLSRERYSISSLIMEKKNLGESSLNLTRFTLTNLSDQDRIALFEKYIRCLDKIKFMFSFVDSDGWGVAKTSKATISMNFYYDICESKIENALNLLELSLNLDTPRLIYICILIIHDYLPKIDDEKFNNIRGQLGKLIYASKKHFEKKNFFEIQFDTQFSSFDFIPHTKEIFDLLQKTLSQFNEKSPKKRQMLN